MPACAGVGAYACAGACVDASVCPSGFSVQDNDITHAGRNAFAQPPSLPSIVLVLYMLWLEFAPRTSRLARPSFALATTLPLHWDREGARGTLWVGPLSRDERLREEPL